MNLHPDIAYDLVMHELEQAARDAERHRFAMEHADQLRPRTSGVWARLLHRIRPSRTPAKARQAPCETASAR